MTAVGNNLSVSYAYDGNDKRVKSFNAVTNQTTIFVYDADGQLAAEYTINIPPPTNPTISYLTEDALGSVRVVTNSFGEVKARRDFMPFGEELYAGIGNRNTNQKYSANGDDTRKKFATYQRDVETGLDYAQSRYYSPMFGRFTSPDEFKGGPDELFDFEDDASNNPTFYADLENPQSLNKYQYTYNNPYKFTDPDGHCPPVIIAGIAIACIILSNPTPIGPRQPQSTGEIIGDVLSILPGGRGAGGVIGGILTKVLKGGGETLVKQVPKAAKTVTKTYQTYTKTNVKTAKVYTGRTSGKKTPRQNVAKRDSKHHRTKDGYGPAKLDKSSKNKDAIRGREQQVIDKNRRDGKAADQINGISPKNKNNKKYLDEANKEFGKP